MGGLVRFAGPESSPNLPGAKVDGSVLLPNPWSLRPTGKRLVVVDFPVNLAVHPSGKFAVVLHSGYGQHELVSVALPEGRVVARTTATGIRRAGRWPVACPHRDPSRQIRVGFARRRAHASGP